MQISMLTDRESKNTKAVKSEWKLESNVLKAQHVLNDTTIHINKPK